MTRAQIRKARTYAAIVAFRYDHHNGKAAGKLSYGAACQALRRLNTYLTRPRNGFTVKTRATILDQICFSDKTARRSSTFRRVYAAMQAKYGE